MLSVSLHAYSYDYYYWYQGKQIPLRQGSQFYIIYDEKESRGASTLQTIEGGYLSFSKEAQYQWGIVSEQTVANAKNILYQMPSFVCSDTTQNMFVTHRFYVKLKQQNDTIILHHFVEQYQAVIETEGDFPLWYIIRCGLDSQHNALSLANIFYESGLFAVAEPEFINAVHVDCVNDPMFSQQWNLKNTDHSGIGINYCDAHAITQGDASVIIGVYDLGVDLTHPDINLYSFSYDVNTQSSPSTIYTTSSGNNYHGTACAGIIGAKTDNSIGVAGIAPNCPIMSLSFHNTSTYNIGNGFRVAADNGCSVISNSWYIDVKSQYVDEGIDYALTHGRDGKGCVIVFSAGNENRDSINYPANSNDSIIVVGAMSPCGERCNPYSCDGETNWGSNYGDKLDIMAPGVLIPTTDNVGTSGQNSTDYMTNFNGTSSACPHVAAVAGLILSVNPYLTQKEVADIIESTAQKLNWFNNNTPYYNYPNGTWRDYVGYGLVDAYAAVTAATEDYYPIQGPDYVCDTAKYYLIHPSQPGDTVLWTVNNGNYVYPHYSIIGADNQDTVYIKCERANPVLSNSSNLQDNDASNDRQLLTVGQSVSVTISNGTSETYTKEFRDPIGAKPEVSVSNSSSSWNSGTFRTFTITNCTDIPDTALTWEVKNTTVFTNGNPNMTIYSNYTGRTLTYLASTPRNSTSLLQFTITNTLRECTPQYIVKSYVVHSLIFMHAYNEGNILHVTISEDESREASQQTTEDRAPQTLELWHNIYGCMRTQPVRSNHEQIDITGLTQGVYVLLLKENGEVIEQTKVNIY